MLRLGWRSSTPFPRISYDEAIARFGTDRPDTRFGLEIRDLGDALADTEFKVFRGVLEGGGVVRGLNAGARELSRAELDGLIEFAQGAGRRRPRLGVRRGGRRGLGLALAGGEVPQAGGDRGDRRRARGAAGDLLLLVADEAGVAAQTLGALRLRARAALRPRPPGAVGARCG